MEFVINTKPKTDAAREKTMLIRTATANAITAELRETAKVPETVAQKARIAVKDAEKARVQATAADKVTSTGMVVLRKATPLRLNRTNNPAHQPGSCLIS
jgi:hypothetical protein